MTLDTTKTITSENYPEVRFTVKVLNVIERARRDLSMATARAEYLRLNRERDALLKALLPRKAGDFSVPTYDEVNSLPDADQQRIYSIIEQAELVHNGEILPAEIRAALVSIDGVESGGVPATVETIIAAAPSDLLAEIHAACVSASGLTGEQEKNLHTLGSSAKQADGTSESFIVANAA